MLLSAIGFTSTGYVNGDDVDDIDTKPTVATTATATRDVGSYATTASGGEDNNYSLAYTDGVLTISKATATITVSDNTVTYNGKAHGVTVTTDPVGLEGSVSVTYDGSANQPVFVASYAVVASMDDKNYQADNVTDTLTIEQGGDTYVTLAELPDVYYGDPPLDLGLRASTGNRVMVFVAGPAEVANDESRLVTVNDVGTVDILLYALGAGIPADKRFQAASFEVKKRNLLITADDKSRAYGSDNPALTYINLGSAKGTKGGQKFNVFKPLVDPDSGDLLGYVSVPIGQVEVIDVQTDRLSQVRILEGFGKLEKNQMVRLVEDTEEPSDVSEQEPPPKPKDQ